MGEGRGRKERFRDSPKRLRDSEEGDSNRRKRSTEVQTCSVKEETTRVSKRKGGKRCVLLREGVGRPPRSTGRSNC